MFYEDTMTESSARLHNVYRFLLDLLYPNICPCCGKVINYNKDFCEECRKELVPYSGDFTVPGTDGFIACCYYEGKVKDAVLHFKHDPCGNTYYAFACGIAEAVLNKGITDDIDLIVPIPISANKMKERGYNQTELIAEELRFIILKPCINALSKKKDTKEQKSLSYKDRIMNIKDSYEYSEKAGNITGKRILLIDDVCTTGSTLSEAASVLRSAGASKIYAASFARTRYRAGNEEKQ